MNEEKFAHRGKVAIVTGAGSGIGRATAQLFDDLGATVIATDINEQTGEETVASFKGTGRFLKLDVTSESDWEQVVDDVRRREERLDILVNNAGIMINCPFMETTLETFRRQNQVNVESVFIGMRTAVPLMQQTVKEESVGCSIINVSSIFGQVAGPTFSAYSASKGAVRMLSKAAANELAASGIRVNSVHPGGTRTNLDADWEPPRDEEGNIIPPEQMAAIYNSMIPMGRIGEAPEIASVISFLASDAASYITGAEYVVDGGWTIR